MIPPKPLVSTIFLAILSQTVGARAGDYYGGIYPTTASILSLPATETVYMPTTYAYTSYSYPTTFLGTPPLSTTSYYLPTSAYLTTSAYSYRSNSISARRAARMALYAPTTYYEYVPTVFSSPLVATTATATGCVESPLPSFPAPPPSAANGGASGQSSPKSTLKSSPSAPSQPTEEKSSIPEPSLIGKPSGEPSAPETPRAKEPIPADPVPADPVSPISPPPSDPKPPGDQGASTGEPKKPYLAMKPKPGELTIAPSKPLAIMRGRVTSGTSGAPLPKSKVVLTNPRFANPRTFTADDQGAFEVPFLPDGDWALAVEDKDGKALEFGVLTVSAGRVYDDQGRLWTSFNLSR